MKIGIVTLPLHVNYGGIVQAFALKTVLERQGHEVWLLDRDGWPKFPLRKKPREFFDGVRAAYLLKHKITLRGFRERACLVRQTRRNTQKFIDKFLERHVPISEIAGSPKSNFDAFVVGSDQIWRPGYEWVTLQPLDYTFLSFAEGWNVKRVSYAPSFGVDTWEFSESQTQRCSELLERFDAVSVREHSGVRQCRDYLGVAAIRVLDPTLLLDTSDYEDVIGDNAAADDKGVFSYVLDPTDDKIRAIDKVMDHAGSESVKIEANSFAAQLNFNVQIDIDRRVPSREFMYSITAPPVESWLQAFRNANFVITDSFHGCAFSILFHKPFFVYANAGRGLTRFESLLNLFGLDDRLIVSSSELSDRTLAQPIDWDHVDGVLKTERARSLRFLEDALGTNA